MTNRELDKWIAENVMEWNEEDGSWFDKSKFRTGYSDFYKAAFQYPCNAREWQPTESISDAFQVVEKMIDSGEVGYFEVCRYADIGGKKSAWACYEGHTGQGFHIEAKAQTAPLAICLAAKKAIESTTDD